MRSFAGIPNFPKAGIIEKGLHQEPEATGLLHEMAVGTIAKARARFVDHALNVQPAKRGSFQPTDRSGAPLMQYAPTERTITAQTQAFAKLRHAAPATQKV